jgi:hypothetical protein
MVHRGIVLAFSGQRAFCPDILIIRQIHFLAGVRLIIRRNQRRSYGGTGMGVQGVEPRSWCPIENAAAR